MCILINNPKYRVVKMGNIAPIEQDSSTHLLYFELGTLTWNARDVGSNPALGTLFPIFITLMTVSRLWIFFKWLQIKSSPFLWRIVHYITAVCGNALTVLEESGGVGRCQRDLVTPSDAHTLTLRAGEQLSEQFNSSPGRHIHSTRPPMPIHNAYRPRRTRTRSFNYSNGAKASVCVYI